MEGQHVGGHLEAVTSGLGIFANESHQPLTPSHLNHSSGMAEAAPASHSDYNLMAGFAEDYPNSNLTDMGQGVGGVGSFPRFGMDGMSENSTFMSRFDIEQVLKEHHQSFMLSSNFDTTTQVVLICAFSILIMFGATGNGLVCYVVARNPHMRTPRNIFIINLAISDLTLCLFTQPFNLMKVSMPVWNLGDFMCKFVPMFAGTNVFVSTISITAIALDRFQVIVYPTKDNMRKVGAVIALVSIWTISFLMASPLLIFSVTQGVEPYPGVILYQVCVENPNLHYEKGAYSIASMIFQYIVPIAIVIVAHARICNKLKYRMINQQTTISSAQSPFVTRKKLAEAKRKRKTNLLLVFIAIVFACSWMPLNVFNIMADFDLPLLQSFDTNTLVFPICHLLVLSSACTNPVLYGWLNENFRKEFMNVLCCKNFKVLCQCWEILCCKLRTSSSSRGQNSVVIYTKASNGAGPQNGVEQETTIEMGNMSFANTTLNATNNITLTTTTTDSSNSQNLTSVTTLNGHQ